MMLHVMKFKRYSKQYAAAQAVSKLLTVQLLDASQMHRIRRIHVLVTMQSHAGSGRCAGALLLCRLGLHEPRASGFSDAAVGLLRRHC